MFDIIAPWSFFSDPAYYDKWAIQHKNRRNLYETLHVNTKGEAEFLTGKLNELEVAKQENNQLKAQLAMAREAVDQAPHGNYCPATPGFLPQFINPCNCWKFEVLSATAEIVKQYEDEQRAAVIREVIAVITKDYFHLIGTGTMTEALEALIPTQQEGR